MDKVLVKIISVRDYEYRELLHFRNELLRKPLGLNLFEEDLNEDSKDFIIIALNKNEIIGCVMLQPHGEKTIKLRQMAVAASEQGKGIGKILVEYAEKTARENDFQKALLHARIPAKNFYEKLGYTTFGEVFEEVTIPHIAMKKELF